MNPEEIARVINECVPYIEIGETKDGNIYFRTIDTDDEALEMSIVDSIVGAMMDNPRIGFLFMLSAVTYISEMAGEEDANKVVDVLMERMEKEMGLCMPKKRGLQN